MLTCSCVKRLLKILENRPDRKVKTAIYVSKTADLAVLGHYVRQYLEDESYISRGGYWFDYDERDVFIETTDSYVMFKDVLARDYEIIFVIEGDEHIELNRIVDSLSEDNYVILVPMDCKLRSYLMLDKNRQPRQLKRKQV